VLAVTADAAMRAGMGCEGLRLTDYAELERSPDLSAGFAHVVLIDPPPNPEWEAVLGSASEPGGYLHRVWGDAEWRFSLACFSEQLVRRPTLVALYRDLRDAPGRSGEDLREALIGDRYRPRSPETAARGLRVLTELGLLEGTPDHGRGGARVVSSGETDLERSVAFRSFSARFQEVQRYLEGQRQP
jgi:hypothetical protein